MWCASALVHVVTLADDMRQITGACIGLRYLHSKRIVHGDFRGVSRDVEAVEVYLTDIWKDNILISSRGIPVVADLGFAKVLTSSAAFSAPSKMGNPAWTSPELQEDDAVHTLESDVWACGMTILVCCHHLALLSS